MFRTLRDFTLSEITKEVFTFFLLSSSLQRHFHSTETQPEIKELSHITSILALSQVALKLTVLAPKTNIKSCLLGVLC